MKNQFLTTIFSFIFCCSVFGQMNTQYLELTRQASSSLEQKQYQKSAKLYSKAFKANSWKAYREDRYNAARAWALAGTKDSAFSELFKVAALYDFVNYNQVAADPAFASLKEDARWKGLREAIIQNIGKSESGYNRTLVKLLDSIYREAQTPRMKAVSVKNEYGWNSPESNALWKSINTVDSLNLLAVDQLIAKYGWLPKEVVGNNGNSTLTLVILHSPLADQEKYLPRLREAVQNKKADPADLALLEDRIALQKGGRQIYGSVVVSFDGKKYYISPLEAPEKVDERRAGLGLEPMNVYLRNWGLSWDVKRYKRELAVFEKGTTDYSYLFFEK